MINDDHDVCCWLAQESVGLCQTSCSYLPPPMVSASWMHTYIFPLLKDWMGSAPFTKDKECDMMEAEDPNPRVNDIIREEEYRAIKAARDQAFWDAGPYGDPFGGFEQDSDGEWHDSEFFLDSPY